MRIGRVLALAMLMIGLMATSALAGPQIAVNWLPGSNASIATLSPGGSTFVTFCLEHLEYFYPNRYYDYTIDSNIKNATGSVPYTTYVTQGAVDLYVGYLNGSLPVGVTATQVQDAIWATQGYNVPVVASLVPYINLAAYSGSLNIIVYNLYDATNSDGLDGYAGVGPVRERQSFIRVPDGGLTVMLLGLGVGALAMISRKLRA